MTDDAFIHHREKGGDAGAEKHHQKHPDNGGTQLDLFFFRVPFSGLGFFPAWSHVGAALIGGQPLAGQAFLRNDFFGRLP